MLLVYSFAAIVVVLVGLVVSCSIVLLSFLGIYLTLQGWWGIGVPVAAIGVVVGVAALIFLFAKVMAYIEERVER